MLTHHNVLHVHHMMHDPQAICLVKERIGHSSAHCACFANTSLFFLLPPFFFFLLPFFFSSLFFCSFPFFFSFPPLFSPSFFPPPLFSSLFFFPLLSFPPLKKSYWFAPELRSVLCSCCSLRFLNISSPSVKLFTELVVLHFCTHCFLSFGPTVLHEPRTHAWLKFVQVHVTCDQCWEQFAQCRVFAAFHTIW